MQTYAERPFLDASVKKNLKGHPELLQELLAARDIATEEDAERFLNPDYEKHTHDPCLMKDMERAVERVLAAIERDETIAIYSDYDCDGIPGGVLLHDFFKSIGYASFLNYIPHRHDEGYGLNKKALEALRAKGASLLITVDSGIGDVEEVAHARSLGLDVIITDHHIPPSRLPSAYAILNPKQEGDSYPDPMLCGTAVAFKLVQGILARNRFGLKEGKEKWLLDMVGLATIADMVPLRGENRVFASFGLSVLRKSPRLGLQQLCRKIRVNQRHITEDDIGFMIAPRINAASRMDEPMEAFRLLATDSETEAAFSAEHLNAVNDKRKGVVASMIREIRKRLQAREVLNDVIVIGDPKWRPALLGLAANTLVEEYNRPMFLWGREGNGTLKGSCRSDGSVCLVEMMNGLSSLFLETGGHSFAGGFSITSGNLHTLEERLCALYKEQEKLHVKGGVLIDRRLSLDDVSWETYRLLERCAPFGEGNPKPLFLFPRLTLESIRKFGRDKTHTELVFLNSHEKTVRAIDFFSRFFKEESALKAGDSLDLVASIEKSLFGRAPELRLRVGGVVAQAQS